MASTFGLAAAITGVIGVAVPVMNYTVDLVFRLLA